ncbi:hypothetical protein IC582_013901 [Cucumis melo]
MIFSYNYYYFVNTLSHNAPFSHRNLLLLLHRPAVIASVFLFSPSSSHRLSLSSTERQQQSLRHISAYPSRHVFIRQGESIPYRFIRASPFNLHRSLKPRRLCRHLFFPMCRPKEPSHHCRTCLSCAPDPSRPELSPLSSQATLVFPLLTVV